MEAGVDPIRFWKMTVGEILNAVQGYHERVKWQAVQTYTIGSLVSASIGVAFGGGSFPKIQQVFPGMFDDLPQPEQKPRWQIMKEQVLAHSEDYKKRGGGTWEQ